VNGDAMRIGVLGAGRMAEGLVPHWLKAGHDVMIGGRTPEKARDLATWLGARHGSLRDAADFGEVILLAVLHAGVDSTLRGAGAGDGALAGKVLIDCTNPVEVERFTLTTAPGTSVAEEIAAATGANVVKAFNQVHFHVWLRGARYHDEPLVVPIAGAEAAKAPVFELVRDAGGQPLDAGGTEQALHLEAMAAVIIRLLYGGADPLSAFQLTTGAERPSIAA
jgi:8-hydroxy-5-deazaflavin:NADPH oxidoreductase